MKRLAAKGIGADKDAKTVGVVETTRMRSGKPPEVVELMRMRKQREVLELTRM